MKSERPPARQPSSERNQKIASIITLLITISAKIEKIKQKLCGFSPTQFSPQCIFQALDLTSKGYLDLYDIRSFLGNQSIKDKDIILLFIRCSGNTTETKMTYLAYLNLLKPYFNVQLARDLIKRDTMLMKRGNQQRVIQTQETVLLLINELILLHCVCIAQHQELKEALLDEYMLNILELSQIIGMEKTSPFKAIHQFIDNNSEFDVEEGQTKYLLSYLKVHQYDLIQQHVLTALFMPTKLSNLGQTLKTNKPLIVRNPAEKKKLKQQLHTNYNKTYIGKQDLFSSTNKMSFLNYIHPNSIQPLPQIQQVQKNRNVLKTNRSQGDSHIAEEHKSLGFSKQNNRLQESYKQMKKIIPNVNEEKLDYSVIEASNAYVFKDVSRKLNNASQVPLHTPVLEQFMHQSNIRRNMGQYNGYTQNNQLNTLLEQRSNISDSQAFVRPEEYPHSRSSKQQTNFVNNNRMISNTSNDPYRNQHNAVYPKPYQIQRSKLSHEVGVEKSQAGGILSQFIRGDIT